MTSEVHGSSNAGHITDFVLHDEIKYRAYELYEQSYLVDGHDPREMLRTELLRVVYAAAQVTQHAKGEVADTRAVRAAQVYLRALASFISKRQGN